MNAREHTLTNPLASLPSVLAIRDLRRRIRRCSTGLLDHKFALRLLHLDPPAVLRAMRAACAPIYRDGQQQAGSIDGIAKMLGPSLVRRALDVPVADVTGTSPIRRLWLHSLATAHAAKTLAMASGLLDPETAYLAGLLHDLPQWLEYLGRRQDGTAPQGEIADWLQHWHVPQPLAAVLLGALALQQGDAGAQPPASPAGLICAAELLAELADFDHPGADSADLRDQWLERVDRDQLLAAQKLRREVETDLREIGLDLSLHEPDLDLERVEFQDDLDSLTIRPREDGGEVVLSLLGASRSASYRGIVTASTSAALRHLGFDRAFYVKWIRGAGRVAVRTKADLSARRVGNQTLTPTAGEIAAMEQAMRDDRPVRASAVWQQQEGLLRQLGVDEALVVAVNRDFQTPAFLVLDRGLSARGIQLLRESESVTTLAMTTSLLNENLLLKLRRQRAHKFASTDPLTRLHNRRLGIATLDQEIARATRGNHPLTVLMLDLDDFKKLNDQHGHLQGDFALRATAEVLRRTLRKTDTICRYGGEEFLVVLPDTAAEDASILAARLFIAIESRGGEIGLPTTVSIGLASVRPGDSVESLLQRADKALYASKSLGRNRFSVDAELD